MEHSFNIDVASKYGIEEAIIIKNIQFWIDKNKANEKHFYQGRYWTYNSVKAFMELFPYMSESKIRRVLENLVSKGVLIKGNFNQSGYDRTLWYSFQNEQMDVPEMTNGVVQNDEPIPDIKQDSKPVCTWSTPKHPLKDKILEENLKPLLRLDPPTDVQCDNLIKLFTDIGHDIHYAKKTLWEYVTRMYNFKNISKNRNFYLTCNTWITRDIKEGQHRKDKPKHNPLQGTLN